MSMLRTKASPLFRAVGKAIRPAAVREKRWYLWRPPAWDRFAPSSDLINRFDRQFRELERDFDRFWSGSPFGRAVFDLTPRRAAADLEHFHLQNPIVEEEGKKKFKLVFDASHFKPNDITIKTSGGRLSIKAKHESKEKQYEAKYEYNRDYDLPDGVKPEEVTCKYTSEGHLIVEAPYTPPPVVEATEQQIKVKHE